MELIYFDLICPNPHYSNSVQERLTQKRISFVSRIDNPPNVPQACSIETVWTLLE